MSHFPGYEYVLFICALFLEVVEFGDQFLLNSDVLSFFSGVMLSIRWSFANLIASTCQSSISERLTSVGVK